MSSRAAIIATLAVLAGGLLVAVVAGTPWRPLPSDAPTVAVDATRDFTAAQIAREDAFHAASRPPAYLSLALGLVIALVLGLSPLGARLVSAVASPFGGGWWWRVVLGTVAITLLSRLLVLPLDGWREAVLRRYGLSTRGWGGWLADVGKSYGVGLVLTLVVVVGVLGLARRSPDWWWAWAAALGAVLVIVISFAYPIVVEPVFNRFTPMAAGPLRTSLLDLAARDGVPAKDVLVADASRRTSTVNAYVSGFGATRRIVVYDNLVDQASPEEVRLVVAHELGHAKNKDVLWGTLAGALGIAALVCVLGLLLRSEWLLGRAGVSSAGDARAVALLLALVAVLGVVTGPGQLLVSRRIEARADVHALDLTRDPEQFVTMQRRLSVTNLSDLDPSPLVFGLFASHPTGPQRIALARSWARQQGLPEPPSLVP